MDNENSPLRDNEIHPSSHYFTLQEQRAIIKYLHCSGKNPIEIHREMTQICPKELMNIKNIRAWVRRFRKGRNSTGSQKPGRKLLTERHVEKSNGSENNFENIFKKLWPQEYSELITNKKRRDRAKGSKKEKKNEPEAELQTYTLLRASDVQQVIPDQQVTIENISDLDQLPIISLDANIIDLNNMLISSADDLELLQLPL